MPVLCRVSSGLPGVTTADHYLMDDPCLMFPVFFPDLICYISAKHCLMDHQDFVLETIVLFVISKFDLGVPQVGETLPVT